MPLITPNLSDITGKLYWAKLKLKFHDLPVFISINSVSAVRVIEKSLLT